MYAAVANWMRPELALSDAEQIIARAWERAPNRMVIASLCLAAVSYLDAIELQPDCSMRNVTLYKQVCLHEIGLRVRSSATATSDETILCLGNIIAFEVWFVLMQAWLPLTSTKVATLSPEATVHLQGLKSLLDLKGGTSSLTLAGLPMMLESYVDSPHLQSVFQH